MALDPRYIPTDKLAGNPGTTRSQTLESYVNESLPQSNTVPIGGTTDGDYTIRITDVEEDTFYDSTFGASSDTADAIADGVAAAIEANEDLNNVVDAAGTPGTPLLLTFQHTNRDYVITFPSNPGGNMTLTTTQVAGGSKVEPGRGVIQGSSDELARHPQTGDVEQNFVGIVARDTHTILRTEDVAGAVDGAEPGRSFTVCSSGDRVVNIEDAVAKGADVYMRIIATATNPNTGYFRSDADTANAIKINNLVFGETLTSGGVGIVVLNRPQT